MWEWQLADSEVSGVQQQGNLTRVQLSAVTARPLQLPAGSLVPEWGYALGVVLHLEQTQIQQCDPQSWDVLPRDAWGR
jgi:hypothetical protein